MRRRGFTLVEIIIVVLILGILAAIAMPQFTNASNDARTSSVQSTLQSLRSQMDLFKVQHGDCPPTSTAITNWNIMLTQSTTVDTAVTVGTGTNFGPYIVMAPMNPTNGKSAVGTAAATTVGWVYTNTAGSSAYSIQAVNTAGTGVLTY